jgi:hypothetical protein
MGDLLRSVLRALYAALLIRHLTLVSRFLI